jgi:hypothetical protein
MEQGASFLGVPAPMLPSQDEGLGFHQDGTVRKAGGSGTAGPSDGGRRAAAYAGSGLMGYGGGSYLDGYVPWRTEERLSKRSEDDAQVLCK